MAITHKSFALGQNVTSTSATARQLIVSATNGVVTIEKASVKNDNGSNAYDIYVYLLSDTVLSGTVVEQTIVNVAANTTAQLTDIVGHKIPAGGSLQVHDASGADLYITVSGIERTQ